MIEHHTVSKKVYDNTQRIMRIHALLMHTIEGDQEGVNDQTKAVLPNQVQAKTVQRDALV